MTIKITELFNGLNKLCETNEAFSFSEQEVLVNNTTYTVRSFSYRLASWSEFKLPFAKDARGTAFYTKKGTQDWELFCRGYQKFHNLGEGSPSQDYVDSNTPHIAYEKLDGSLILVGMIEDKLLCKSKTSITSKPATLAQKLLDDNILLQTHVSSLISKGYTSVFELVGPDNTIAIKYDTNKLIYLGIIENEDYSVSSYSEGELGFVDVAKSYKLSWDELFDIQKTSGPNIEGYVVKMTNGDLIKLKVTSYIALHNIRDSVKDMKSLAHLIVSDHLDDLFSLFEDDKTTLDLITRKQLEIAPKYNHFIATIEDIVKNDFDMKKRDFAIKHQKENKEIFGLLMPLYLKKETNSKQFFIDSNLY